MIDLSTSQMHVPNVLNRPYAADQPPDPWPLAEAADRHRGRQSATPSGHRTHPRAGNADPGRLMGEVARWHASIRSCDGVQQAMRIKLVDDKGRP
jgi:hypothetical protein